MAVKLAVADTSVLINLHYLGQLDSLSVFYRQVLIPGEVRVEFLKRTENRPSRENTLLALEREGLFSPCNDYSISDVDRFKINKLDRGEAEALSQLKMRGADISLIDEKRGRRVAKKEMQKVEGTALILARLHILGVLDIHRSIEVLRSEDPHIQVTDQIVQEALDMAKKERDINR